MAKKVHSQTAKPKTKKSRFAAVRDTIDELRKVVWPSRQESFRLTVMVIVVCAIVGAILGILDWGFGELVQIFFGTS